MDEEIKSKTITTYLLTGNPQGIKYIFIDNVICKLYVIPKSELFTAFKIVDLQSPSFYILIGEDEKQKSKAYIGETENFIERIKQHYSNKNFWEKALVFITKDKSLTKAEVQYLEHLAYTLVKMTKNFNIDENKQNPNAPNLPEHLQSNTKKFFEDVKLLTSFVGCNIFDKNEQKGKTIFYLKVNGIEAKGYYDEKGFTVLKGSSIRQENAPSLDWKESRNILLNELTKKQNDKLVLQTDHTFQNPSRAKAFCSGSYGNGWEDWKTEDGTTLDKFFRKKLEN